MTIITNLAFGQSLTKEVDSIYNFYPSKLSDKEKESKMPLLNKFWAKIKTDTLKYLPELRKELSLNGHNPYFYYDGSGLLLSLTKSKADKEIAIEAISKCDLEDISPKIFTQTLNYLANDGLNVTKPAVKILANEKYSFFIPQHAMTFNQGYCLTYTLVPQNDKSYIDTLITLFKTVKPGSQKSIITTLWFEYSCKGDTFLKTLSNDNSVDKEVRNYAKKILGYTKMTKDKQEYLQSIDKKELAEIRKKALQRFSDEAIDELDMTTRAMRKDINCH